MFRKTINAMTAVLKDGDDVQPKRPINVVGARAVPAAPHPPRTDGHDWYLRTYNMHGN